jgi:hypothetical protein
VKPRDDIRMEGSLLGIDESRRILCPFCKGGQSNERSMNITRTSDGVLYNCHRVSCPSRPGFVGTGAHGPIAPVERTPENYEGELHALTPEDEQAFWSRFNIHACETVMYNEHDEYVLPIYGPDGYVRGYNIRQPWDGMPRKGRPNRPKSRVYMHSLKPVQSTYEGVNSASHVLLVEDQLSAIKASQCANVTHAVALLGAHLDIPRVQEIAQLRPQEVLLALDADATETAFKLARLYGLAFPRLRVVILDRDIKDTPANKINEVLGI